jgi:hypothetical protein
MCQRERSDKMREERTREKRKGGDRGRETNSFSGSVAMICWAVKGTISWKAMEKTSGLSSRSRSNRMSVRDRRLHGWMRVGKIAHSSVLPDEKSHGRRGSDGALPLRFHVPEKMVISRVEENSDALKIGEAEDNTNEHQICLR